MKIKNFITICLLLVSVATFAQKKIDNRCSFRIVVPQTNYLQIKTIEYEKIFIMPVSSAAPASVLPLRQNKRTMPAD